MRDAITALIVFTAAILNGADDNSLISLAKRGLGGGSYKIGFEELVKDKEKALEIVKASKNEPLWLAMAIQVHFDRPKDTEEIQARLLEMMQNRIFLHGTQLYKEDVPVRWVNPPKPDFYAMTPLGSSIGGDRKAGKDDADLVAYTLHLLHQYDLPKITRWATLAMLPNAYWPGIVVKEEYALTRERIVAILRSYWPVAQPEERHGIIVALGQLPCGSAYEFLIEILSTSKEYTLDILNIIGIFSNRPKIVQLTPEAIEKMSQVLTKIQNQTDDEDERKRITAYVKTLGEKRN